MNRAQRRAIKFNPYRIILASQFTFKQETVGKKGYAPLLQIGGRAAFDLKAEAERYRAESGKKGSV